MATIRIYDSANRFSLQDFVNVELDQVSIATTTQTTISIYVGNFFVSIGGNFSYDYYGLTGGTLRSLSVSHLGAQLGSITGLSHDIVTLAYSSSAERYLMNGDDTFISSYSLGDIIRTHAGNDTITAGTGDDRINGGSGDDIMFGSGGNDRLFGGTQNDRLFGGKNNDLLKGEAGRDILQGDAGKDTLFGGAGADKFVFRKTSDSKVRATKADIIKDFQQGQDKIDLHFIDASTKLGGNNTFIFKGTTKFGTSKQGEIYFKKVNKAGTANDFTMVYIDTDNDRQAEMSIKLSGLHNLTADDFIL